VRSGVPRMRAGLCANVQLNRGDFDFSLKSSLMPFFRRALQLSNRNSKRALEYKECMAISFQI